MKSLKERLIRASSHLRQPKEAGLFIQEARQPPRIVFLAGPTGCGKTALSLLLAESLQGEIVCADSMQIYQGMDIGTAKATLLERRRVPHHLIDVCPIHASFSVVDYYYTAQQTIEEIQARGKLPIVVGGAGFYIHSLLYGPPSGPPSVPDVRRSLEEALGVLGPEALYEQLLRIDPDYASSITVHDRQKIVRGLEIIQLTGLPVSAHSWQGREVAVRGAFRAWFIHRPRSILYERVEERCEQMVEEGLLAETEALCEQGMRDNRAACHAIGYKQALAYLDSERTEEDFAKFMSDFKQASRHYVKRQFTWFRKEPLFKWIDVDERDVEVLVEMMIQDCRLI
ncbi:MAG: tRNA (adenosine(37)-N6)-dimethylallyltransferase MiaA [Verrucomicrobia bacterium]|nr:tRNA (adenosine(37)-N6)-dimethylallyltransferase MiaA [Verrucomicrobiota bacterium]